jgi:hypothetical protein
MHGNTPHAGSPGTTDAGQRATADVPDLSPEQKRVLQHDAARIAHAVRDYLPQEYVVGSDVGRGMGGPEATVAVQPPAGDVVSAGFAPDPDGTPTVSDEDREEVARGLAASAAWQVKRTVGSSFTPAGR